MFHSYWADLHAGTAGGAVPDHLVGNDARDKFLSGFSLFNANIAGKDIVKMILQVLNNLLGTQRFTAGKSRAGVLAAAAASAGIKVKELFPCEVFYLTNAEKLGMLKVNRNQGSLGTKVPEKNVDRVPYYMEQAGIDESHICN
jgi:hypothetical protein